MRNITVLLIFCLTFLLTNKVSGQWTTNTEVNTLAVDSEGGDMKAIGTSDGSTYVVFWKSVASPTNYELRLQRLDALGIQQLGTDGVLISDQILMSTFTVTWSIAIDNQDNIYVGVTGTGDESGHLYVMNSDGNHVMAFWRRFDRHWIFFKMLPLSNGDVIVSWLPNGPGLMQRFDNTGSPVWQTPKPVAPGAGNTVIADMFELSDGGFTAVYHSLSFGINSTLYAQRYDEDGNGQWTNPVQLASGSTAFNREYGGTQDGDIVYFGYFSSASNRFDSYVQRIDPDGSLPWGLNGADFDTNETDYEMDTRIAFEPGSDYVWAMCTYTNVMQTELGERVQKFDKNTGERMLTEHGNVVYAISGDHYNMQAIFF